MATLTKYSNDYQFENPFFTEATVKDASGKEISFRFVKNQDLRKEFNKFMYNF